MQVLSSRLRLTLVISLAVLWTAWAIWANSPHHYDAQAMQRELAGLFPQGSVPKLEPAVGGFPIVHMRYDFSRNDQLTIHDFLTDKLGLNVLLCALATISIAVLAARTTNISYLTLAFIICLCLPLCVAYVRLGLHPIVIAYAYFLPLLLCTASLLWAPFRSDAGQNQTLN